MVSNEIVANYRIDGKEINVYGCFDSETAEGEYDFFDLVDEFGETLNEGSPYYEKPTLGDVKEFLEANRD